MLAADPEQLQEQAFDFMAKHGIGGIIGGGSAKDEAVERHMIGYPRPVRGRGIELELASELELGFQFHIAKSREDGMREAAKHYEENMKMFGELRLVRALTDEQITAMRDPQARRHDEIAEHRGRSEGRRLFLTGTPADIIEQLKAVEKRYPGVDRVVCAPRRWGPPLRSSWKTWINSQRRSCPPSKRPR